MNIIKDKANQIFSFHIVDLSLLKAIQYLLFPFYKKTIGLNHSEISFVMGLGKPIFSPMRYKVNQIAFFACWNDETDLQQFLDHSDFGQLINKGWHVRMKPYRRWGFISELKDKDKQYLTSTRIINVNRYLYYLLRLIFAIQKPVAPVTIVYNGENIIEP